MTIDLITLLKSDEIVDINPIFDFIKEKYNERARTNKSLLDNVEVLSSENNYLQQQILNLKKELKNYVSISINDKIMGRCIPTQSISQKIPFDKEESSEEENSFKNVIAETFCSEMEQDDNSIVENTFCEWDNNTICSSKSSDKSSPILCTKYQKSKKRTDTTPPKLVDTSLPDNSTKRIQITPTKVQQNNKNYRNKSPKKSPRLYHSTEVSPKSKVNKYNISKSQSILKSDQSKSVLTNNSIDFISLTENSEVKVIDKSKYINKKKLMKENKVQPDISPLNGRKLKQINIVKSFKRPRKQSPADCFNFESAEDIVGNSEEDFEMNESELFRRSPRRKSPQKNKNGDDKVFRSPKRSPKLKNSPKRLKSPIAGSSGASKSRVKKKLQYNETTEEADVLLNDLFNTTSSGAKEEQTFRKPKEKSSYLEEMPYVRDAVKKKSERRKMQGWACEDCKKYYEAANLTDSQMKQKIDACSRHRNNYDPFATNTPPGFWNPEFPPTQENNRTQTSDKISSKP